MGAHGAAEAAREAAADERRTQSPAAQRVLDTASVLFYEHGIGATGVDTVIARSGVAKMTLYKHYGSKDELVAAYLRGRDRRWRERLVAAVAARTGPEARIAAVLDTLDAWLEGEVEEFRGCAFVNAAAELPDPGHPGRRVVADHKRWMRSYLGELSADLGVRDAEALAEQLFTVFEGATVAAVVDGRARAMGAARGAAEALIAAHRPADG
ncbi:TetR/AcrR family transcriptional regulator [Nocardiopsis suaedae]|uniref:TetR/AcrR family transcriptional regulator n=1 Tax=Nocardiopsis suaedae TaxID=3018444 RepID=A0ABT4TPA1_9ACTN|nr:TetR/AcrR family transcriptional regulator [Nocardiopsis suaedae]MDA2806516.1 TetR/AcrR family transcriptional regulator [Nocardiopsis suaedae]